MGGGDPQRLRAVLKADTVYLSPHADRPLVGADEIIGRLEYVNKGRENAYITRFATITEADGADMAYAAGTRCILLSPSEEADYESMVFLTTDEAGMIEKIEVCTDGRYRFRVDPEAPVHTPFDDLKLPDSVVEPIFLRAKLHGFLSEDTELGDILESMESYTMYRNNAEWMLEALQKDPQPDVEAALENILGYLFAKAIEHECNERRNTEYRPNTVSSYAPEEAFAGRLTSTLCKAEHKKLERAMARGRQFYRDYEFFVLNGQPTEAEAMAYYTQAAIAVQRIGQLYAPRCLEDAAKHGKARK